MKGLGAEAAGDADMLRDGIMVAEWLMPAGGTARHGIAWRPIANLPDAMRDGRYLLFWDDGAPVVAYRADHSVEGEDRSFWSTGFVAGDGGLIPLSGPTHWAEIPAPGLWPDALRAGG